MTRKQKATYVGSGKENSEVYHGMKANSPNFAPVKFVTGTVDVGRVVIYEARILYFGLRITYRIRIGYRYSRILSGYVSDTLFKVSCF
ncbi:hypothetical protein RHGRI_011321 [Rhododendron griersonianum]|uniref:Uncharacterized protein n=1 Tax=Rhododendron griersonianum TaxID=479676 RepID=A0AAV6KLT8_9ERIC|nr:hypothetical protein RHGRI_011321 [Rhododendron griersonianum]